ncbi:MAG: hypothetical protein ACYDER_07965 [Ktedonobacteraceae bacterium]
MTTQQLSSQPSQGQLFLDRHLPVKLALGLVCFTGEFFVLMIVIGIGIKHPLLPGDWMYGGILCGILYLFWVLLVLLAQRQRKSNAKGEHYS